MRKLGISEILKKASEQKSTEDKVRVLRENNSPVLTMIIKYALDPTVVWDLPKGAPPYKENTYEDTQSMLYQEARRLYLFVKGGNNELTPLRREQLFIGLLESLDRDDAKLLCSIKDKKLPFKGITKKVVDAAFPGLIS